MCESPVLQGDLEFSRAIVQTCDFSSIVALTVITRSMHVVLFVLENGRLEWESSSHSAQKYRIIILFVQTPLLVLVLKMVSCSQW